MSGYYGSQNPPNQSSDGSYYNDYYSQQQQQQQHGGNPYENQQQHQQNQQFYQQNQNYSNPYLNQPSHYGSQPQDQQFFQQQQQQPMNSFFNPATATAVAAAMANSGMSSDTMIDLAQGMGKNFLQNSTAKMIPGLESTMVMLRTYFAVDNKYVVQKMKKTLIPFLSKDWRRIQKSPPGPGIPTQYELPQLDPNAPDLYLPSMSLITYVLLCALSYGNMGQFNPEVIPDVTTKCFVTQILEVLAIRFGFYMMQAPVALLDLFSYTGYKYLGLSINMLIGLFLGHFGLGSRGYYITFLWTASAASFFMLKTMANTIPRETASGGPKREMMVLVFAASQFATMWFVSQTKFL